MSFLNPPSFQTGDVLSASKVNHLLTDIDTLYGWYYGPNYGIDQQQFDTTQTPATVEGKGLLRWDTDWRRHRLRGGNARHTTAQRLRGVGAVDAVPGQHHHGQAGQHRRA